MASTQNAVELLSEIRDLLIDVRAELQQASEHESSFEIKTSPRGVDLCAKAYRGSSIDEPKRAAIEAYFDGIADVQRRVNEAAAV